MATHKQETRKIVFKDIPLPNNATLSPRYTPYPFEKLRIGGQAMVVNHVTYGAVVLALRKYMALEPNTAFYLLKTEEGTVVWRVKLGSHNALPKDPIRRLKRGKKNEEQPEGLAQDSKIAPSEPVHEVPTQSPPIQVKRKGRQAEPVVQVDELYVSPLVSTKLIAHLLTPSGKRQMTSLTDDEKLDIYNQVKLGGLTTIKVSEAYNLWPANVGEVVRRVGKAMR